MYLQVTDKEFDTILAALRYWQAKWDYVGPDLMDIATAHGPALKPKAIDRLCERLNVGDVPQLLALPGQLLAALERASAACESHNAGGKMDYDWIGEADRAIAAARAAGIEPQPA